LNNGKGHDNNKDSANNKTTEIRRDLNKDLKPNLKHKTGSKEMNDKTNYIFETNLKNSEEERNVVKNLVVLKRNAKME